MSIKREIKNCIDLMKSYIRIYSEKKIQFYLFFIFLILPTVCLYPQGKDGSRVSENIFIPQNIQSPSATMLHKFIDVPVGYYTGVPEISIPIYEIKLSTIVLPISIDYHSSGIKVDQHATSVGLGWNLQCGGLITHNQRMYDDFIPDGYVNVSESMLPKPFYGFGYNIPYSNLLKISGAYAGSPEKPEFDCEPDIFYYSYPGGSGKFVYDRLGTPHTIPFCPIKIDRLANGYKIIDEKGNQYEFTSSSSSRSIEIASSSPRLSVPSLTRNYNLTKVLTPNGEIIDFVYDGESFIYDYENQTIQRRIGTSSCNGSPDPLKDRTSTIRNNIGENRLTQITTNMGHKIDFIYNTIRQDCPTIGNPPKELDEIKIYYNSTELKKFILNQEYFNAYYESVEPYQNKHLKLLSIKEDGKPEFIFSYYNEDKIVPFTSKSQDLYGYNNGVNNSTLIPSKDGVFSGATRTPNINFLKAGILKSITYPTRGSTEFDYEMNSNESAYIGGLRIKSIIERDINGIKLKDRYFEYIDPNTGNSSAVTNSSPVFYENLPIFISTPSPDDSPCELCSFSYWLGKSHSSSNLNGIKGGNVGYKYVTEMIGQNGTGGKTIYHYNHRQNRGGDSNWPYTPEIDFSWASGLLIDKTVFSFINNRFEVVKKNIYEYHFEHDFNSTTNVPSKINENFIGGCVVGVQYSECINEFGSTRNASLQDCRYYHVSAWYYLKNEEDRTYKPGVLPEGIDDVNNYLTSIVTYDYNNPIHAQLTGITADQSDGIHSTTDLIYPHENLPSEPYQTMVNRNIIAPVIEKTVTHGTATESIRTDYFNPSGEIIVPLTVQKTIGVTTKTIITYNSYDDRGNLTKYTGSDGMVVALLWAYNKTYPVAKIICGSDYTVTSTIRDNISNRSYCETDNKTQVDADILFLKNQLSSYFSDPNFQVALYTYKPLVGMTSETASSGLTTYYEYDTFGRLIYIRNSNGELVNKYEYNYKTP